MNVKRTIPLLFLIGWVWAQEKTPPTTELKAFGNEAAPTVYLPVGKTAGKMTTLGFTTPPQCGSIPTATTKTFNSSYSLDTDAAGKLGITFVGTGSADLDKQMKVFIREFSKSATCESSDGTATLLYGASWRATVLIDQFDASGKVSFAVVAASATLKNRQVQVFIEHQGFVNESAIDQADQVAMTDTKDGLSVSTYAKFNEDVEKAATVVSTAGVKPALVLIGMRLHGTEALQKSVASVFALRFIAEGKTCNQAIAALKDKSSVASEAIKSTYTALTTTDCDASDKIAQVTAARILNGVRIDQK